MSKYEMPAPKPRKIRCVDVRRETSFRDGTTKVQATFVCLSPEAGTELCAALMSVDTPQAVAYALDSIESFGRGESVVGMAPELAAPYGKAAIALWPGFTTTDALQHAYDAGVRAAREAFAAAKYDAERDGREWSVREVEVPPYGGK